MKRHPEAPKADFRSRTEQAIAAKHGSLRHAGYEPREPNPIALREKAQGERLLRVREHYGMGMIGGDLFEFDRMNYWVRPSCYGRSPGHEFTTTDLSATEYMERDRQAMFEFQRRMQEHVERTIEAERHRRWLVHWNAGPIDQRALLPGAVYWVGADNGEDLTKSKPETLVTIDWPFPDEITRDKFSARLLRTNIDYWNESDQMRNCVYRSYWDKAKGKSYAIYHVDAPHLGFRNGFTVGFDQRAPSTFRDLEQYWMSFYAYGASNMKVEPKAWRCEQIKGKANSQCADRDLQNFCDYIADILNGKEKAQLSPG